MTAEDIGLSNNFKDFISKFKWLNRAQAHAVNQIYSLDAAQQCCQIGGRRKVSTVGAEMDACERIRMPRLSAVATGKL